ncbi:MAG: protease pro-enzyme activation domain-containing protein [Verrucomicrobiota bacterium]
MGACPISGAGFKQLHGHVPEAGRHLPATGRLPATNELHLTIGVPLRDTAGLGKFLAEAYDPDSPNYRQFLTPEEFAERFSAPAADYAAVKEFARTNGFKISGEYGNRLVLDVTGKVGDVERAFHIKLNKFRHPTEARDFFAPDAEPTVEAALPVVDVQGLSDYSRPHAQNHRIYAASASVMPQGGSGSGGAYLGDDFRNAYAPGTTLTGAGQQVGLLQFDGYYPSDIAAYAAAAGGGRTNIVMQTVLIGGFNGLPGNVTNGNEEVSLDIEMAMAMAPGLSKIVVFEAASASFVNSILAAMTTNTAIKQFSCSWGWSGGPNVTTENLFTNMAALGQSFFNASGDGDSFADGSKNDVNNSSQMTYPFGSPNITLVGGTVLAMNGNGISYLSETNWNDNVTNTRGGYWGSSGGISTNAIPYWQTNISMAANHGSAAKRNIPDVALTAANCYIKYGNGSSGPYGGTSAAAPLWAGYMALVNQQAALGGKPAVGFINPAIYAIGKSTNYTNCFHDITDGNNYWPASPTNFPAVAGYDLCTGWGTPNGANLINALAGSPVITPLSGFSAVSAVGGPFSPSAVVYSLTNASQSNLLWSLVNTSVWLNVSATSGTLTPNAASNVTVSLSAGANSLIAGIYGINLVFTNRSSAAAVNLPCQLFVGQNLVQNGGFEAGNLTSWTQWVNSGGSAYTTVASEAAFVHSGTFGLKTGPSGSLGYLAEALQTTPGQSYLLSFWLVNPTAGDALNLEQFNVSWNGTNVYGVTNPPIWGWTNFNFVVTAIATNSTLQFAFQNEPDYFGLDDVNVTPIPIPSFTAFSKKTNSLALTWNSLAGLAYRIEYKTNLLQTNWVPLATNFATTGTSSYTNILGTNAARFFRVYRLP